METTRERAISLLMQRPPLSLSLIGRLLGVSKQYIFQVAESSGELAKREEEAKTLDVLLGLQHNGWVSREAIQGINAEFEPNELKELTENLVAA